MPLTGTDIAAVAPKKKRAVDTSLAESSGGASTLRVETVLGARAFDAHRDELRALRVATGQAHDTTTDPDWLGSPAIRQGRYPWLVLLRSGKALIAALHLYERRYFDLIPSGYLRGDDAFGQRAFLCPEDHYAEYLRAAIAGVLRRQRVHLLSLVLGHAIADRDLVLPDPRTQLELRRRVRPYRLPLQPTLDTTLARFGKHTRRNLRYYMRQALDRGWQMLPSVTPEQAQAVIATLASSSTHPIALSVALQREALMRGNPKCFALGIVSAPGEPISYLNGWREPGRTFVYWQLNHDTLPEASISTVMRAYLLEQEVTRGAREIVFIDGTSSVIGRYCIQDECIDVLARRRSLRCAFFERRITGSVPEDHPLRRFRPSAAQFHPGTTGKIESGLVSAEPA